MTDINVEALIATNKEETPPHGCWVGGVYQTAEQLQEAADEEAAAAAASNVTPDWFEYLVAERQAFVANFWKFYEFHGFDAKESVWAENMVIAFDQMLECIALIYKRKLRSEYPTAAEEDLMEMVVRGVFGDFAPPSVGNLKFNPEQP